MSIEVSDNTLNLADERPLYKQIEDRLETYIRHNDLDEGSMIPSLRLLADQFSTNELTVWRAIRGLVDREILVTRQGRGTFVNYAATRRKILWVCGVGVEDGEVSPFYQLVLRRCTGFCAENGYTLQPVWAGSHDKISARRYCNRKKIDEYAGYVFIGCRNEHSILQFARENNLKHVVFSHDMQHVRRGVVTSDYAGAVRLGLDHLQQKGIDNITIVELQDSDSLSRKVAQAYSLSIDLVGLPHQSRLLEFEQIGYLLAKQLIEENRLGRGVFILDDIVAKGMTRAMLQIPQSSECQREIVILSALQAIAPTGLPVTHIVNDVSEMATQAMDILVDEIEGRHRHVGHFVSPYVIHHQDHDTCGIQLKFSFEKLTSS